MTELRKGKQPEDFLFTRNGEPVRDFRGTWDALTKAAGLPGLLLHDFRRSAVRNMTRRGVPQKTAREISGHKTDAVFSRYNITSEAAGESALFYVTEHNRHAWVRWTGRVFLAYFVADHAHAAACNAGINPHAPGAQNCGPLVF